MVRVPTILAVGALALATACAPATTQEQRNANCVVGTAGGAALGGIAGNQFGGGTGNRIMTVAGATAGGLAGANAACQ